jgi:putative transposase
MTRVKLGSAGLSKLHKDALWSPSYFAVSVGGAPIELLKQHIKDQSLPYRRPNITE